MAQTQTPSVPPHTAAAPARGLAHRYRVTFDWEVLSPLHVGGGGWRELHDRELPTAADHSESPDAPPSTRPFAAALVRDHQDRPTMPGSGIKGALRARAAERGLSAAMCQRLFDAVQPGTDSEPDSTTPGVVEFSGARWLEGHESLEVRTAIDRDTRTVADGKLFNKDRVEPGARFRQSMILPAAQAADVAALIVLIQSCTEADPLPLGGGTRAGAGGVRLRPDTLELRETGPRQLAEWLRVPLNGDGTVPAIPSRKLNTGEIQALVRQHAGTVTVSPSGDRASLTITLAFEGPFAVRDPRYRKSQPGEPDSRARADRHGRPMLPGTSFLGALCSQAERILQTLREGAPQQQPPRTAMPPGASRPPADLADLLFGTPGWRGLLGVRRDLVADQPQPRLAQDMVPLCRVTGGGRDTSKFLLACWSEPVIKGELTLDLRRMQRQRPSRRPVTATGSTTRTNVYIIFAIQRLLLARSGWRRQVTLIGIPGMEDIAARQSQKHDDANAGERLDRARVVSWVPAKEGLNNSSYSL